MWILCVLLAVAGFAAHATAKQRLKLKHSRFAQRDSMPLELIAATYYPTFNKDEVKRVWALVGKTLALDAKTLRPTDRFANELAPVKGFLTEDELVDLEDVLKQHCRRHQISRGGIWLEDGALRDCRFHFNVAMWPLTSSWMFSDIERLIGKRGCDPPRTY